MWVQIPPSAPHLLLGDSLTVERLTLDQVVGVRVPVPQHFLVYSKSSCLFHRLFSPPLAVLSISYLVLWPRQRPDHVADAITPTRLPLGKEVQPGVALPLLNYWNHAQEPQAPASRWRRYHLTVRGDALASISFHLIRYRAIWIFCLRKTKSNLDKMTRYID